MTIVFWNVCRSSEPGPLFDQLNNLKIADRGVDYLCLNEATRDLVKLFKRAGWQTFYDDNDPVSGILVAGRRPLSQPRKYSLSSVGNEQTPNQTSLVLFEAKHDGGPVTIATTHLTYFRFRQFPRRKVERSQLLCYLPRQRTVFGGDLNTVALPLAKYTVRSMGFVSKFKGKTWQWHLEKSWNRIPIRLQLDHVFVTGDINPQIKVSSLGQQKFSDHYPLLVELNPDLVAVSPPPRRSWRSLWLWRR